MRSFNVGRTNRRHMRGLQKIETPLHALVHPRYKTTLCATYLRNGYCGYGAKCMFAHGPEELSIFTMKPIRPPSLKEQTPKTIPERRQSPLVPRSGCILDPRVIRCMHMGGYRYSEKEEKTSSGGSETNSESSESFDLNVGQHDIVLDGKSGQLSVRQGLGTFNSEMNLNTISLHQLDKLCKDIALVLND